ncbi:MAG: iron-containing redox enzyme family protein [Actinobacteria bacterium]|nr:iron-containing redox enzyme family protein [Actinomycetota bacterium]MCA1722046.1 iron-containing redox enzyme family protein [Actinomycetota bacterium]
MTPPVATAPELRTLLATALAEALETNGLTALYGAQPVDRRDRFLTLLAIYDLHTAPLETLGATVRHQGHPVVADLKSRLESDWLVELDAAWADAGRLAEADDPDKVVQAMRSVAAKDRLPAAYRWLAKDASWNELVDFLALEGGPDGGFDDLVAVCQVGLSGSAKLELGKNYWDEMGNGNPDGVHTVLHQRMAAAIGMRDVAREDLPVEALERAALGGLLATNRWLQPEMLGALGLLELQAGPRCRLVLQAFDRLGAPEAAYPFYVEHAEVDPVHGKDWMDKAVVPTVAERPAWGPRIVKGAWWRSTVNLAFFEAVRVELLEARAA